MQIGYFVLFGHFWILHHYYTLIEANRVILAILAQTYQHSNRLFILCIGSGHKLIFSKTYKSWMSIKTIEIKATVMYCKLIKTLLVLSYILNINNRELLIVWIMPIDGSILKYFFFFSFLMFSWDSSNIFDFISIVRNIARLL